MASKPMTRTSNFVVIREMQMKATMKYRLPFTTKVPFLKGWHQHTW